MYSSQDLAVKIKAVAKEKNKVIKDMLIDCGLGSNSMSSMYHGKAIAYDSLAKIADYLECSVDYLLGRTDQPDMQATITVGNITGDNNANLSINNTDCDQFMKEFYRIISQMDFRQRTELMLMIYNYIDNKKSR